MVLYTVMSSKEKMQHINLLFVAFKMLVKSKKKFFGMIVGATFSAFILMQQPSIYRGITDRLVAQILLTQDADLWVMDSKSSSFEQPTNFNPIDIYRIRSVPGVSRAVNLYRMWLPIEHLKMKKKMNWEVIGVDPDSLVGLPENIIAGNRDNIHYSNAVVIDGYSLKQFETEKKETIQLNDKLEGGGRNWVVTGVTKPLRTYSYQPKVYISSDHIPNISDYPSFIVIKVSPLFDIGQVARNIHQLTEYDVLTTAQFSERTMLFFRQKTPIIVNFISVAVFGFFIGLIMMWQIFSNFILTHLHQFGMLKMLGVSNFLLVKMVSFQAAIIGGIGYFIGLLLTFLFGAIFYDTIVAFHLTWQIALLGVLGIVLNIALSSYFGILKILRLDTVDLCRDLN